MEPRKQLNKLALGVHASVATLNVIIAVFNRQRGNKWRARLHWGIVLWELVAITYHTGD